MQYEYRLGEYAKRKEGSMTDSKALKTDWMMRESDSSEKRMVRMNTIVWQWLVKMNVHAAPERKLSEMGSMRRLSGRLASQVRGSMPDPLPALRHLPESLVVIDPET